MNIKTFIDLVESMREAQRSYFNTRDIKMLNEAKKLERRVDEAISIYRADLKKQGGVQMNLFKDFL